jgi:hypothetical protein
MAGFPSDQRKGNAVAEKPATSLPEYERRARGLLPKELFER